MLPALRLRLFGLFLQIAFQMVVVPIEDALVVVLHFFDGRSRHAVAAVGVADPGDFFAQAAQRVIHLHRLTRGHVVILFAGHQQQRSFDAVGEHNRGMRDVFLRLLPQRRAVLIHVLPACGGASGWLNWTTGTVRTLFLVAADELWFQRKPCSRR